MNLSGLGDETGRSDDVIAAAERAAALIEKLADPGGIVDAYLLVASHAVRVRRYEQALQALARAEDLLRPHLDQDEPDPRFLRLHRELLVWRGVFYSLLAGSDVSGDWEQAAYDALESARVVAARLGDHDGVALALVQMGKLFALTGRLDEAEERARLIENVPAARGYEIEADELLARVALGRGRAREAAGALAGVADAWREEGRPDRAMAALASLGEAYEAAGDERAAVDAYERTLDGFEEQRLDLYEESRLEATAHIAETVDRLVLLLADADSEAFDPSRALHWAERSKSRVFLEMLGLSHVPLPDADESAREDLLEEERLLERVNALRDRLFVDPEGSSDRFTLQQELFSSMEQLHAVWARLVPAHEEYVALREGRVAALVQIGGSPGLAMDRHISAVTSCDACGRVVTG